MLKEGKIQKIAITGMTETADVWYVKLKHNMVWALSQYNILFIPLNNRDGYAVLHICCKRVFFFINLFLFIFSLLWWPVAGLNTKL